MTAEASGLTDEEKEKLKELGVETSDEPSEDAPEQPNGVLIVRIEDEEGNISTDTVPLGNVKATEVQTIIELGLSNWRAKLGLNG
jgi:ACT domain-containing protein